MSDKKYFVQIGEVHGPATFSHPMLAYVRDKHQRCFSNNSPPGVCLLVVGFSFCITNASLMS